MKETAILEIQKAIYETIKSQNIRVYDYVANDIQFPCVVIGEDNIIYNGTKTRYGEEVVVTLHVWSRYQGKKECKMLLSQLHNLFLNTTLTLQSYEIDYLKIDNMQVLDDVDGITKHGILKLRIYTKN